MSEVQRTINDLYDQLRLQNRLLAFLGFHTLHLAQMMSINGMALPGSRWWTWFTKTLPLFTIPSGATVPLIDSKELPTEAGYFHSLNLSTSSGGITYTTEYTSPNGETQKISDTLANFRAAGFNKYAPASAGDPIVLKNADDTSPAIGPPPEWAARVSPSFNIPFHLPFRNELTNGGTSTATIYGFNIYFLMLKNEAIDLIKLHEEHGIPDFLKTLLEPEEKALESLGTSIAQHG